MALAWSPTARNDLRRIRGYIAQHHPQAARRIAVRIIDTSERLISNSRIGPPGRQPDTREIVVPGTPYLIVYRLRRNTIEILRVLHGRQDWPATDP
jgi:addiction module RelE/StbE family toxin